MQCVLVVSSHDVLHVYVRGALYVCCVCFSVWRSGIGAFTANLNINLRRMVPHGSTQRFRSQVERQDGRKLYLRGVITSPDQKTTYADATGLWIQSAHMGDTQKVDAKGADKTIAQSKL